MKTLLASLFLSLFLISPARATPVMWTLEDVTLADGGELTGSFMYDADSGSFWANIIASGYGGPDVAATNIATSTFTQESMGGGMIDDSLLINRGSPGWLNHCYNDPDFGGMPTPCSIHSTLTIGFIGPLSSNTPVGGQLALECIDPGFICQQLSMFPIYDLITSGHVCTEIPCPGGPPIQVPEPSSLLILGIGILVAAASKHRAIITA